MSIDLAVRGFAFAILVYFAILNVSYLALIGLAAVDISRRWRRNALIAYDDIFSNPLTPPVTIIIPAHNEALVIVDSVRSMLSLRYSEFEVVVVDDGSTDGTFEELERAFDLVPVDRVLPGAVKTIGEITGVYGSSRGESLWVIRKASIGCRSDAVNAGIDLARYPLVCMVDADSMLEEEALLRVAKPFVDDPERVVAAGGVIRIANGSTVYHGRVEDARPARTLLPRIQNVEYVRSFLLGRLGWSKIDALPIISGAFGLFRRDILVQVGGYDVESIGEDMELVVTIHEHLRKQKRDYRIEFVPEPVSWIEAPSTLSQLAKQRRRWSRGLAMIMHKHRRTIGNPRYGIIGMLTLPYYVAFELLSPVVEVLGLVSIVVGLATGAISWSFVPWFLLVSVVLGVFVSACALTVEELTFHRYHRWIDLQRSFAAALCENLGYRQLHAYWRLRGLIDHALKRDAAWGVMVRQGFKAAPERVEA